MWLNTKIMFLSFFSFFFFLLLYLPVQLCPL